MRKRVKPVRPLRRPLFHLRAFARVWRPLPRVARCDVDRLAEMRSILPKVTFRKALVTLVALVREVHGDSGVPPRRRRSGRAA